MIGLTVFRDHVIYHPDIKVKRPPIEGVTLSKLAELALRFNRHRDYLLRAQRMTLRKSSDYDGYPFEDFYEIGYEAKSHSASSYETSISLTFTDTLDDDHDYVTMASRSTTTAYKRGSSGKPKETRFKAHKAIIRCKEGEADVWIQGELARLQGIFDDLDQATQSLRSWADSGLGMKVLCATAGCRSGGNPAIVSSGQLLIYANQGLSFDDFKQKLRCKVCGARCSSIFIA